MAQRGEYINDTHAQTQKRDPESPGSGSGCPGRYVIPGPFDVTPDQVTTLAAGFTNFMNELLEADRAANGDPALALTLNWNESVGDGGVDADYTNAAGSERVPAGHSAWQYKSGPIRPKEAADELAAATDARACLKAGGTYVLAIGGQKLPSNLIKRRRKALVDKAVELGDITADDANRIKVYDANEIARWASQYPRMAVSHVLQNPAGGAVDFTSWQHGNGHQHDFCYDDIRTTQVDDIRERLADTELVEIRIQGESGYGKTRLAMEALSDDRYRSLVAYVDDERRTQGGLIETMIAAGRQGIVVVDECPAERHQKLVEKLPAGSGVKLITIGDIGAAGTAGGILGVQDLGDDAMDELLKKRFNTMGPEARRFVRDNAAGNARWAILLAQSIERAPEAQAADLIATGDLAAFIETSLPQGKAFFCSAVLALFERVGWDRDLRTQKEAVASFAGVGVADLDAAEHALAERGLIHQQGRYRGIAPAPFALYLAAEGWKQHGARILDELVPTLDEEMVLSLFRRLAQLGRYQPGVDAVAGLLGGTGPFGTLDQIENYGLGSLLTQLAIVAPDRVAPHLAELIQEADEQDLASHKRSRRALVWTLEKLAWHTRTFELAADALLRLGLAENETYSNNASGSWVELFGGFLPGTAATPTQRAAYLQRVAANHDPRIRLRVVQAASHPMRSHESITVSAEIQGGVLVEPRGAPITWNEHAEYRRALLNLLDQLRGDADPAVAEASTAALLHALHPLIDDPFVGGALADILAGFTGDALRKLRIDVEHYISLHTRHPTDDRNIIQPLKQFRDRLPAPNTQEAVQELVQMNRWDLEEGELEARLAAAVANLDAQGRMETLDELPPGAPGAWEFGRALAASSGEDPPLLDALTALFDTNASVLLGYLLGLVDAGDETAFDRYLNSDRSQQLTDGARLSLAVRGPATPEGRARVLTALGELPVREAAPISFAWHKNLDSADTAETINGWAARTESQDDYNALVDWANLVLHGITDLPDELHEPIWNVVRLRSTYPNLGQEAWDWGRLAGGMVSAHPLEILSLLLNEIESGVTMVHSGDDEVHIIQTALTAEPEAGWADLASRLEAPDAWRLPMQLRGWVQFSVPHQILDMWVGSNVNRARILAGVAAAGGEDPTELTSMLLDRFGDDDQVASSIAAGFVTGVWTGPYSERVQQNLNQMNTWRSRSELPLGVRKWAGKMVERLTDELKATLEREAEGGY